MQPAPDVVDPDAEAGQRIRLQIDVTKIDCTRPGRVNQPMVLPVNAGATDRAFGVVPNREFLGHDTQNLSSIITRICDLLAPGPGSVVAQRCRRRLTRLERDDFSSNRHPALSFCLSMIFSENRYPLFRIML
jgi:hypothetical protein